jgi:CubicO group peptidase (beta-lactamase class C family)
MKTIIVIFIGLTFSLTCVGQPATKVEIPNTPAGKRLTDWLLVFAGGNQDSFTVFIARNYDKSLLAEDSAYDLADRQARRYMDAKSYVIRSLETSRDNEITVIAQSSMTELWFRITMKVKPDLPHKITEYTAQRIPPPEGTQKQLSEKELVAKVEQFMDRLVAEDAYSGTLLIAKGGKTLFKRAYGLASKAYNAPITIDTKLNLASIGKMFTAIAIAQLMEQKRLSLTDTVGTYLPQYPNEQVRRKVTIHHLLTHSSGLGDYHGSGYICSKGVLRQVKDYFPLFEKDTLAFEPGAKCQYSNAGYIILGAIIEKVSGENYFDYIRNHIFEAVGMPNTDFYETDIDVPNRATGYTNFVDKGNDYFEFHLGERRNTSLYSGVKGIPAGGAFSTADDLLRFTQALKSHKLVSAETFKLMTTNKIFFRKYDTSEDYYGYGFELEVTGGKRVIGHGGGDLGISSGVRMYPDAGDYTLIILSNYDRGGILVNYKIQEMLTQY